MVGLSLPIGRVMFVVSFWRTEKSSRFLLSPSSFDPIKSVYSTILLVCLPSHLGSPINSGTAFLSGVVTPTYQNHLSDSSMADDINQAAHSSNAKAGSKIEEKRFKCDICSYSTKYKHVLLTHKRIHTGEKPFKCTQCSYASAYAHVLKKHMCTHTGVKPYKCSQCSYACAQLGNLKTHMLTHTGEKPYKCSQCSYACTLANNLTIHIRSHTGEKPYKCSQCLYACAHASHLKTHMRTHTGEKPYKCSQCSYVCKQASHLKTHLRTHTGSGSNVDDIEELDSASSICIVIDDEEPYEPEHSATLTCDVKSEVPSFEVGPPVIPRDRTFKEILVQVNFLDTGNEEMCTIKYENLMTIQSLLSDVFKRLYSKEICEPNFYKLESVRISDPNTPFSTDCQIINIVDNPASIFDFVFASRIYNFEVRQIAGETYGFESLKFKATSSMSNENPSTSYERLQHRTTLEFTREQSTSNCNSFSGLNDPKPSPRRRSPGNPRSRYNRSSKRDISPHDRRRCSRSRVDYSATRGGGPYRHQHSESSRGRVSRSSRGRSPSRSPHRSP
ncbi:zinc-finger double domain-containing protein [Ditylenchus destructor]|nr:zinc-finger double domain-containing protein [Ditylenchus destructor]